jgi:hypothetical protein
LETLFQQTALPVPRKTFYRLEGEVEDLIQRSFPNPGDADKVRQMFVESLDNDGLGMDTRRQGEKIRFAYPIAVLCADVNYEDYEGMVATLEEMSQPDWRERLAEAERDSKASRGIELEEFKARRAQRGKKG